MDELYANLVINLFLPTEIKENEPRAKTADNNEFGASPKKVSGESFETPKYGNDV